MFLVLKLTKKCTHNMILTSRNKRQLHDGKRANKFGQGRPHSGNARKKTFFLWEVFPYLCIKAYRVDCSIWIIFVFIIIIIIIVFRPIAVRFLGLISICFNVAIVRIVRIVVIQGFLCICILKKKEHQKHAGCGRGSRQEG